LRVLGAIKEINKVFNKDRTDTPTFSVDSMINDSLFKLNMTDLEAFELLQKALILEEAPWFSRVWTLQEAVIPDTVYLCTPERYILNGASLFSLFGMFGMFANFFIDGGDNIGFAITHALQKSEIWKIIRMRQLWRKGRVEYWPLLQAVRGRQTRVEQDRVYGVLGLMDDGALQNVDYTMNSQELYRQMWKEEISRGDFHAMCFIGTAQRNIPDKDCMGLIPAFKQVNTPQIHHFALSPDGEIQLNNVGMDSVKRVYPIVTYGALHSWAVEFLDLSPEYHAGIATAFGLPDNKVEGLCPAAFAAISSMGPMPDELTMIFPPAFQEAYKTYVPRGMFGWVRTAYFAQGTEDYGMVVIWTHNSAPQLGVVTSKVEGHVVILTPSSYEDNPGEGCLICKVLPNGTVKKIGVGFGMEVKATKLISTVLVADT